MSDEYYPVILLTASKCVANGHERVDGFIYVQGAADDEESWSHGLNSTQFWQNQNKLLECTQEDELLEVINEIVRNVTPKTTQDDYSRIGVSNLYLGVGGGMPGTPTIVCGHGTEGVLEQSMELKLSIPSKSKPLTVMIQKVFPVAISFAFKHGILNNSSIAIVATDSSRPSIDLSIAVTLVLLSLFFDDQGTHRHRRC
jgi:hypothetical protein